MNRRLTLIGLSCAAAIAAMTLAGCGNNDASTESVPVPGGATSGPVAAGQKPAKTDTATLAIPFSAMQLLSPVQHITKSINGIKLEFVKFKYQDAMGTPCVAQMPLDETTTNRTKAQWESRFNMYKVAGAAKTKVKKAPKKVERLNDFPFVSPPRDESSSTQKPQGGLPGGPPPAQPNPYGTR